MLSLPCLIVVTSHSRCTYYLDGVIVYMSELERASTVSNHVLLRNGEGKGMVSRRGKCISRSGRVQ